MGHNRHLTSYGINFGIVTDHLLESLVLLRRVLCVPESDYRFVLDSAAMPHPASPDTLFGTCARVLVAIRATVDEAPTAQELAPLIVLHNFPCKYLTQSIAALTMMTIL